MIWPIMSGTPDLVPVTATHGVTPGGLMLVSIFYFGAGPLVWVLENFYTWNQQ